MSSAFGENAAVSSHRHLRTDRLTLDAAGPDDLDDMYALHADPLVWEHLPSGRHTSPAQTLELLDRQQHAWTFDGLGYWSVRTADGSLIGIGGGMRHEGPVWNLYYRLTPKAWGHGYAGEIVDAARVAAADVDPDCPVTAFMLEHNAASARVASRAGLTLVWRGPDSGNPDPAAIRLVYADRPLTPACLETITG
jgi:RimJ/RimL family protein N-acetyltransferase